MRRLQPEEGLAFVRSVRIPFLDPFHGDRVQQLRDERAARTLETDRAWVAEADGRFVANACIASLDLTLPAAPGQEAPVVAFAGVSAVGVHPTHRRRGLLRQLMARMLDDARSRGEPFAGLLASESVIYGRFGFGHATTAQELTIDRRDAAFLGPVPELDLRIVSGPGEAREILPSLFDRQRRRRAGEPSRSAQAWDHALEESAEHRDGAMGLMHAVCAEGYVSYRVHEGRVMSGERDRAVVEELRGLTPEVEAALWRYVFDVDLVGEVTARRRPVDEPLRWRLADPRRLRVTSVDDRLWVRILDVPAALEARGYRRAGRVVLEVVPPRDALDGRADGAPGRWVLDAGPDGASCRAARRGEDADVRLGVADLGSLYLGGFSAFELAAGGRVEELRPGGLDAADALMAAAPKPLTGTGF